MLEPLVSSALKITPVFLGEQRVGCSQTVPVCLQGYSILCDNEALCASNLVIVSQLQKHGLYSALCCQLH